MNLTSPRPYWLLRNGLGDTAPLLDGGKRVDVAVVGAGITGALVADALVRAGLRVIVLDARHPAQGSTAASTAMLQYEIDTHLTDLVEKVGRARAVEAYHGCLYGLREVGRLARELGDVAYRARPSLYFASSATDVKRLRAEGRLRRRVGLPCETWSRSELAQAVDFRSGLALWTRAAAEVDPYALCRALLERCASGDFAIYARTRVEALVPEARRVAVHTSRGVVHARHVVVAAGYEAACFLPAPVARLHSSYALVTEPIAGGFPGWPERCLIWESARPYLYLRTTSDHRVLVGGRDHNFRDPERRDAAVPRVAEQLLGDAQRLLPRVHMESAYAWAGTFGETRDGLGFIGAHPALDQRILFALGYGGNGITYSALAARVLAAKITGRRHRYAATFAFDR